MEFPSDKFKPKKDRYAKSRSGPSKFLRTDLEVARQATQTLLPLLDRKEKNVFNNLLMVKYKSIF